MTCETCLSGPHVKCIPRSVWSSPSAALDLQSNPIKEKNKNLQENITFSLCVYSLLQKCCVLASCKSDVLMFSHTLNGLGECRFICAGSPPWPLWKVQHKKKTNVTYGTGECPCACARDEGHPTIFQIRPPCFCVYPTLWLQWWIEIPHTTPMLHRHWGSAGQATVYNPLVT